MTLADIIRQKKAVAYLCPKCRKWHEIEPKNITDINSKKNSVMVFCSEKEAYSTGISTIRAKEIFNDILYERNTIGMAIECGGYDFYVKDDSLHFCIYLSGCSKKLQSSTPLNNLEKNVYWIDVKPNRKGYDSNGYSFTVDIMFFIKIKAPCERCKRRNDLILPCSGYEDAIKKYINDRQEEQCYLKDLIFGFRYNLEEEISTIPSIYSLLELKQKYSEMDSLIISAKESSIILENMIEREERCKVDGYNGRIKKMRELFQRLKKFLKDNEKNPEAKASTLALEYLRKNEDELLIPDSIQWHKIVMNYRMKILKDIFSSKIAQLDSISQEIHAAESEITRLKGEFDEAIQRHISKRFE